MKVPHTDETRLIYIAGPMRGLPDFNYPKFNAVEEELTRNGWHVENPAKIGEQFGTPEEINSNQELLRAVINAELATVKTCDAIFLLRGWERSVGAKKELAAALKSGAEIYLEEDDAMEYDPNLVGYIRSTLKDAADKLRLAKDKFDRYDGVARSIREQADKAKEELDRVAAELTAAKSYMGVAQ